MPGRVADLRLAFAVRESHAARRYELDVFVFKHFDQRRESVDLHDQAVGCYIVRLHRDLRRIGAGALLVQQFNVWRALYCRPQRDDLHMNVSKAIQSLLSGA